MNFATQNLLCHIMSGNTNKQMLETSSYDRLKFLDRNALVRTTFQIK